MKIGHLFTRWLPGAAGRGPAGQAPAAPSPAAPRTPPPAVVPSPDFQHPTGFADDASASVFGSYLGKIKSGTEVLTGLYNVSTGQLLFGGLSHSELADQKKILMPGRPPVLFPGWYGFRCLFTRPNKSLNVSPESGVFGKIPEEHLPAFRAAIEKLFSGAEIETWTFKCESDRFRR